MKAIIVLMLTCLAALAQKNNAATNVPSLEVKRLTEERDWLARNSVIYSRDFWISYNGMLFFHPKGYPQKEIIFSDNVAKRRYLILTNKYDRYDLVLKYIADSGIEERYQKMFLVPRSDLAFTNSFVPKLNKDYREVGDFKMIQSFENGDALIQEGDSSFYVYALGRAADDKTYFGAELVKEGLKTYTTVLGGTKTVESFTSVSLNKNEKEAISKISASFSRRVADLSEQINSLADQQKSADKKER